MFEVLRKQMARSVPFAKLLGISVDSMDVGTASTLVAESPELFNHVGTFHAGVLFTACESASGAALAGALLPVIMQTRFVVRDARITYLKPAKGSLSAQAKVVDDPDVFLNQLKRLGRADVDVDVCARAADAAIVAKATFSWSLRLQEP